jgi:hypothetical protein
VIAFRRTIGSGPESNREARTGSLSPMAKRSDDSDLDGSDLDGEADQSAPKVGRLDRIRSSVQSANIAPETKDVSTKWQIDRLDERERRFSFAAAGGALLFGTVIYLIQTQNPSFRLSKSQITPQTTLVLGIVCGALLVVATMVGRRAPVGFVALFTFLAFGTSAFFLGAPFLGLAVWLLYRSYKFQREAAANLREANAQAAKSKPSVTRGAVASAKAAQRQPRSKGPSMPEGNKRYTPKRPPPPAPKPSRRDRKAAKAAD